MSPLDATATEAAINADGLNPDLTGAPQVVQVTLKFDGVTPTGTNVANFLRAMGGMPKMLGRVPDASSESHKVFRCTYDSDSSKPATESTNLLANPGAEAATTGWEARGTNTTIARITTDAFAGVGCFEVTCDGSEANEGLALATAVSVPASSSVIGFAILKSSSGSTALRVSVEEYDAADSLVGTTNAAVTASTTDWNATGTATRAFGATGVKAKVIAVTAGTTAAVFLVDALVLAIRDLGMQNAVNLGGVGQGSSDANPTIMHFLLASRSGTFVPDRIYDAANVVWPTVGSSKDTMARGCYQFTITA